MTKTARIGALFFAAAAAVYSGSVGHDSRGDWKLEDFNTSRSADPSNLKYFKFYDALPSEITINLFDKVDASNLSGKRLYVGYGVVDPTGRDCRVFPAAATGMPNDVTVCLPWWRIERVYELNASVIDDRSNALSNLPEPHPPVLVNVCKEWESGESYPGGKVTCTRYYSRYRAPGCHDNPRQAKCLVTNCSREIVERCELKEGVVGGKTTLKSAEYIAGKPEGVEGMIDLATVQFYCPPGVVVPRAACKEEVSALMYPYQCSAPSESSPDGKYVYCEKDRPQYTGDGSLIGFLGTCDDGRTVICEANTIAETRKVCVEPINEARYYKETQEFTVLRDYEEKYVNVLTGEPDVYASDPNCVRSNTVEESRDSNITIHIKGDGYLDDDIWVFRHKADGGKTKIYCNMQHNEDRGSRKTYDGTTYQCIDNNGRYTFDQVLPISGSDIVSVQEASEHENNNGTPFVIGRNHYSSTRVVIDNILVAPDAFCANYPAYPCHNGRHLMTWDNALGTLSLLFPYAGAYNITFWDRSGTKMAEVILGVDDFRTIASQGNLNLRLAESMTVRGDFTDEDMVCMDDDWVEWGGGVWPGHKSRDANQPCYNPDAGGNFATAHAVTLVVIKDLFTGVTTRVPLVYPLAYPNRVFVSKLKVYEHRKYRCYKPFKVPTIN